MIQLRPCEMHGAKVNAADSQRSLFATDKPYTHATSEAILLSLYGLSASIQSRTHSAEVVVAAVTV